MSQSSSSIEITTAEDEFEINSNNEANPSTIIQRLKEFSFYFVQNIEVNLSLCLNLLEEKVVSPRSNSIHTTVVSKSLSVIPKLGTAIGNAFAKGESMIFEKIDKKNSRTLADLVYYYSDHKEDFRKMLIESVIDLFYSFEYQFLKVTCNEGPKRAMMKLAKDASDRVFDYLLETEQKQDITRNEITKGVICGNSKRNNAGVRVGRTVTDNDMHWKTSKLYRKTGIVIVEECAFYRNRESHTEKYGHRRPFQWENLEDIKENWEQESGFEVTQYFLTINEDLIKVLRDYIMTKTSNEEAKLDRENYHNDALEDRKLKHDEVLLTFRENFKETVEDLEEQYKIILETHNENKGLLQEMSAKQNEENILQQEITKKLQDIHDDISEIKILVEMHKSVQQDIAEIKIGNEELAKGIAAVQNVNVQEIVKKETVEKLGETVKDVIKEALRQNDPGRKISNEIERNVKKIRKLW